MRILDRKKDMINRGGYKIYSVEVENALMALPACRSAPWSASRARCWASGCMLSSRAAGCERGGADGVLLSRLSDYKVPEKFHALADALAAQRERQSGQARIAGSAPGRIGVSRRAAAQPLPRNVILYKYIGKVH